MINLSPSVKIIGLILIGLANIYSFLLFYQDKKRSKKKTYRISEVRLILFAFLFGGIGAFTGMYGLRHKTKHLKFQLLIPLAAILTIYVIYKLFI